MVRDDDTDAHAYACVDADSNAGAHVCADCSIHTVACVDAESNADAHAVRGTEPKACSHDRLSRRGLRYAC